MGFGFVIWRGGFGFGLVLVEGVVWFVALVWFLNYLCDRHDLFRIERLWGHTIYCVDWCLYLLGCFVGFVGYFRGVMAELNADLSCW